MPSYYERLGVTPSASTAEIGAAYRALAQRLHPDRLGDASPGEVAHAERRIREINEAWAILRDGPSRRAYDRDRQVGPTRSPSAAGPAGWEPAEIAARPDDDLVDVMGPMTARTAAVFRHLPWMVAVVVFVVIFVLSAYAGGSDDTPVAPDPAPTLEVGACIDVSSGPTVSVVPCDGPHGLEVVAMVGSVEECPAWSQARSLGRDSTITCVVDG